MKSLLVLAMMLPLMPRAEEINMLAGQYVGCAVSLETTNEAPKSKFYVFTFGTDSSLDLTVESYAGTEKCDNVPIGRVDYKHFEVLDDTGNLPGRVLTAQEVSTKLFYKFRIAKSYSAILSSTNYPVKPDFVEVMILDKVQ